MSIIHRRWFENISKVRSKLVQILIIQLNPSFFQIKELSEVHEFLPNGSVTINDDEIDEINADDHVEFLAQNSSKGLSGDSQAKTKKPHGTTRISTSPIK